MKTSMKLSPPITLSEAEYGPMGRPQEPKRQRWFNGLWRKPFFLLVVLPSLVAAGYLYVVAAPQYVSETRFVVSSRGGGADIGGNIAGLRGIGGAALGAFGGGAASGDAASIRDFLTSLDAVMQANAELDLISLWRRPEADPLARLRRSEPELLAQYFNTMVDISLEPMTNATTLRVRSFRPEDSKALAEQLLHSAEALVNRLSERARNATLQIAHQEAEVAERRVQEARAALVVFREQERELDSAGAVQSAVALRGQLEAMLAQARAELTERLKFMQPDNPALQATRNRIEALERQIIAERSRHTEGAASSGEGVLSRQLASFERLMLEREFADRQLASATASLEAARVEAQRQQIFLSRIAEPNLAVYPLYPRKLTILVSIFVGLAISYGIGWLLIVGMREHAR
jgi:capsular polysaccharide transport system permease protein